MTTSGPNDKKDDDDALSAFDRAMDMMENIEQKIENREAAAEAYSDLVSDQVAEEIKEQEQNAAIEKELAAIKESAAVKPDKPSVIRLVVGEDPPPAKPLLPATIDDEPQIDHLPAPTKDKDDKK